MSVQMYLVQPTNTDDDGAREALAELIAMRGGFILMATSHGSLLAAFDERHLPAIQAHHLVEFAGGVTLNPNAPGAAALQQVFARNVAAQLAERGVTSGGPSASGEPASVAAPGFPPGYRPMRWPMRPEGKGGA